MGTINDLLIVATALVICWVVGFFFFVVKKGKTDVNISGFGVSVTLTHKGPKNDQSKVDKEVNDV